MKIKRNESLTPYFTMGLQSKARIIYFPETYKELITLLNELDNFFILGGGSNTIFAEFVKTPIIATTYINNYNEKNGILHFECGVSNHILFNLSKREFYYNLLGLYGIPGTVGGAIFGNATLLKEHSLFNYVFELNIYRDGKVITINKFNPIYRNSNINGVILNGKMKLLSDKKLYLKILEKAKRIRNMQPRGKSAGSIFKNPDEKMSAGYLIDQCGLKGKQMGDIKISEQHANFFINMGNATFSDFMKLLNIVKNTVLKRFSIELEEEVKIVRE